MRHDPLSDAVEDYFERYARPNQPVTLFHAVREIQSACPWVTRQDAIQMVVGSAVQRRLPVEFDLGNAA
jgi:hypothetical protein